jgi:hypothetical protein
MGRGLIPYPLSAARLSLTFFVFGWRGLQFRHRKTLTEEARQEGETIWWVRIGPLQLSYARAL